MALGGMVGEGEERRKESYKGKGREQPGGCCVRWQKSPSRYLGEGCFSRLTKWPPPHQAPPLG